MWRSCGILASHPTFYLVIYNHKIKTSLQRQGQFLINTSEIDPSTTLDTMYDTIYDDDITIQTKQLLKTSHIHARNIPGTVTCCNITCHEFKAINF